MNKRDGGPAFPITRLGRDEDGMTLRDYFAAIHERFLGVRTMTTSHIPLDPATLPGRLACNRR